MMKCIILLALVCLAAVSELALARHSNLHEWTQYKRQHGKVYETPEEDSRRFALFLATKERVKQHNANEQASHKLGLNHLSDWTPEELAKLSGFKYDPVGHTKRLQVAGVDPYLQAILDDPTPVPAEVDWRKVPNRVSPVKDQGQCGSCWAFATTGVLEGQQVAKNFSQKLIPLSEQDLIDCSINNNGCDGGIMNEALNDVAGEGGIESEHDYPYEEVDGKECREDKKKFVMTDSGSVDLPEGNEEVLKKVVAKYGPVAIAMMVSKRFYQYTTGIFEDSACTNKLDHGILIVGYGTDPKHGDFWIVKNSWTDTWGEKGYFRIRRGARMCGIGLVSTIPKFMK